MTHGRGREEDTASKKIMKTTNRHIYNVCVICKMHKIMKNYNVPKEGS